MGWATARSRTLGAFIATALVAAMLMAAAPGAGAVEPGPSEPSSESPSRAAMAHAAEVLRARGAAGARAAAVTPASSVAGADALAAVHAATTGGASAQDTCFSPTWTDPYEAHTIDAGAYGAQYDCDASLWAFGFQSYSSWYDDDLDGYVVFLDTDLNKGSGCDGFDYIALALYDSGLFGGVLRTPTCNDAGWSVVGPAGVGRAGSNTFLGIVFEASAIGSPTAIDFMSGVASRVGDVDSMPDSGWAQLRGFGVVTHPLSVARTGAGAGSVWSGGGEIDCPARCSASVRQGTTVTLHAEPADGSVFTWWGGACAGAGTSTSCTVRVDAATNVTARFDKRVAVKVDVWGGGSVRADAAGVTCPAVCTGSMLTGRQVTFVATAAPGWEFGWWSGGCKGTTTTCTMTVTAQTTVVAMFARPGTVKATRRGSGAAAGSVVSDPAGLDCGPTCTAQFAPGTPVTLTAVAPAGTVFGGWSGACAGKNPVCALVAGQPTYATANFISLSAPGAAIEMVAVQQTFNCTLQSRANNQYVAAELGYPGADNGMLRARSGSVGAWEKFECVALGGNRWALRSRANGQYVVTELGYGGPTQAMLRARSGSPGGWEQFRIVPLSLTDPKFALRSTVGDKAVTTEIAYGGGGASQLRARSDSVGAWEQFTVRVDPT